MSAGRSTAPPEIGSATSADVKSPATRERGEHGIARNTAFAFVVQVITSAFTAALTIYLFRALGPERYGLFALALSIGGLLLVPSDFGISQSAARFMAERRGDRHAVVAIFGDALKLKLVASGLVSLVLVALAGPVSRAFGEDGLAWPLRAIAIAVFTQSLMLLCTSAFVALGRVDANVRIVASESAVELGATVVLVALGGGAAGAAFGRAGGYAFGAVFAVLVAVRRLGGGILARRGIDRERARRIGSYAGALAIVDGAFTVYSQLGILLIGAYRTATSVGFYTAALRLVTMTQYPGLSVASGVAPRLALDDERGPDVQAFVRALRLLIVFQAALVPPLVVWSRPIADLLLGANSAPSAHVLEVLAPYVFLSGLAPLVSLAVNFLGDARRRIPIAIGALGIDLALNVLLIPRYGLTGAAIAADVGYAIYVPAHIWVCRRIVPLPLDGIAWSLARAAVAAAAASLVLLALGRDDLAAWEWLLGGFGAIGAYLGMLVVSGELSIGELRAGLAFLRRRAGLGSR